MVLDQKITSINEKGQLIVDTRPWIDNQFLITGWNEGISFYLKGLDCWQQENIDPGLVLVSQENLQNIDDPVADYLKQIPDELIDQIEPYQYKQFTLLSYLSNNLEILDVFRHSANLLWLIISEAEQKKWQKKPTTELLRKKREHILEKITGRVSKSDVRFISKILLYDGNQYEFRLIKECVQNTEIVKSFTHWKSISVHALAIVRQYPVFLNTQLLRLFVNDPQSIISQLREFGEMNTTIEDIQDMAATMEVTLPENYHHLFKSKQELDRAHDRMVIRFNASEKVRAKTIVTFPECLIGDKEDLIQIKDSFELATEGRYMHHCVGGYVRQAKHGQYYFYKVLSPERGTVQITVKDKKVSIVQFKLACNKKPSEESWLNIKQLLIS